MKNRFTRLVSLLTLIIILATTVISTSSCGILIDIITRSESGSEGGEGSGESEGGSGGSGGGSGEQGGSNGGSVDNSGEGSGNGTGDEAPAPDFYPGSGFDPEGVTGAYKSLLSAVKIIVNHRKYSGYGYEYEYEDNSSTLPYIVNGSGVLYQLNKEEGSAYVITNYHVVYHHESALPDKISDDIEVYLYGQENSKYKISAKYIGGSLTQDLAVLRIENSDVLRNSSAAEPTIRSSDTLNVLDTVIAVGNPEGMGLSVTTGTVSVESESLTMVGADRRTSLNLRVIRIEAAINEGNSGGGLFDASGNLVGIVNAKRTGAEVDNIAYAIPITTAKNIIDSLIYYCDGETVTSFSKCTVGITLGIKSMGLVRDEVTGALIKAEEVSVTKVVSTSPMNGRIGVDDVITAITVDGERRTVTRTHHITDLLLKARVGSEIVFHVTRGEFQLSLSVVVTEDMMSVVK